MFYLLENNKIIDSENYKEPYILSKDVIRNREVLFLTSFKDQVSVKGTIKKQSENVFDLIEEGDLIKDENHLYEVSEISNGEKDNGRKSAISQPGMHKHWEWEIEAIYKPNSKGDYIKVWEKKDK